MQCPRAWYFKYIKRIKEIPSPALKYGIEFHNAIAYVLMRNLGESPKPTYTRPDIINLVKAGFDSGALEIPKKYLVEKWIEFDVNENITMTGKIDLVDVTKSCIVDHKTCDGEEYALSGNDLQKDLQLNVYGYWYLSLLPNKKKVSYQHNQLFKNKPELSRKVNTEVSRDSVTDYWNSIVVPVCNEIYEVKMRAEQDVNFFEKHLDSCGMYDGCRFKTPCDET